VGDSHFEDYPGDDFEKVREFTPEETPQSPTEPFPEIPSEETLSSAEPRRKRIKTLAGRTDLPWVRKLIVQRSQTSPASHQSSYKQPSQPTRKSHRLIAQGFVRSSSTKQGPPVIEEILSSSEGSPIKDPETPAAPVVSPVLSGEQASTETSPKHPPHGLFLRERLKPHQALHLNLLKSPLPNGPSLQLPPHQNWRSSLDVVW